MKKLLIIGVLVISGTPLFCMKPRTRSLSAVSMGAPVRTSVKRSVEKSSVFTAEQFQQEIMRPPFSSTTPFGQQVHSRCSNDGVYEATCCLSGCVMASAVFWAWLRQKEEQAAR